MKQSTTEADPMSLVRGERAYVHRPWLSRLPFAPPALLVLLPLLLFWPLVVGGRVLYWGTPLLQFYPWRSYAAALYRDGQLPLWNPYLGTGAPLAANLQSAVFYPINLLLFFAVPAEIGLGLSVIIHVALAGLFTYAFVRAIGLSWWAALLSGISYMLSGYVIARAEFLSISSAVPWLPLLLLAAEVIWQGVRTHSRRKSVHGTILLSASGTLLLLAGHAQLAFYSLLFVVAYTALRAWQLAVEHREDADGHLEPKPLKRHSEPRRRISPFAASGDSSPRLRMTDEDLLCGQTLVGGESKDRSHYSSRREVVLQAAKFVAAVALALGLSFGVAAIQLVPTAELTGLSVRAQGAERDFALTYSLWPLQILGTFAPDAFGNPAAGDYWGPGNYWEAASYVGVLPLLLALLAIWRLRKASTRPLMGSLIVFFGLVALGTLLLAMGKYLPFFVFFYEHVPGFGSFQAPARLLFLYTFAVACLAGIGMESLGQNRPRHAEAFGRGLVLVGIGMLIAGCAGALIAGPMLGTRVTFVSALVKLGAMLAISGLLVIFPLWSGRVSRITRTSVQWARAIMRPSVFSRATKPGVRLRRAAPEVQLPPSSLCGARASSTGRPDSYRAAWVAALLAFVVADLLVFGAPLNPTTTPEVYKIADLHAIRTLGVSLGDQRVYTPEDSFLDKFHRAFGFKSFGSSDDGAVSAIAGLLPPNVSTTARIHEAYNYDPLQLADVRRLQQSVDAKLGSALLDTMAVRYVLTDALPAGSDLPALEIGGLPARENLGALPRAFVSYAAEIAGSHQEALAAVGSAAYNPRQALVLEGDERSAPRQDLPAGRASIISSDAHAVIVQANAMAPGYLVLSDAFYPGWQVHVDGESAEILRANYAFRAVRLESGEHRAEFRYVPRSYLTGLALSLTALVVLFTLIIGCAVYTLSARQPTRAAR